MNDELPFAADPPADELPTAKRKIDAMSFEDMLRAVRNKPLSDPLFRGQVSIYFHAAMKRKRSALSPEARAEASKNVGW